MNLEMYLDTLDQVEFNVRFTSGHTRVQSMNAIE